MADNQVIYKPLGELETSSDTSERPYKVFYNNNMGNRTFLIHLPIFDFYRMSDVANELNNSSQEIAQRPIDFGHANKLANYILKGLIADVLSSKEKKGESIPEAYAEIQDAVGKQSYISIQPLVCNLRSCARDGKDLKGRELHVLSSTRSQEIAAHEILLSQKHILWVIDGQHRRKAIQFVFDFLDEIFSTHKYPGKKTIFPITSTPVPLEHLSLWSECNKLARESCSIAAEVHLGLNPEEERQLFHDLNNLGKRVEQGLALVFDRGNPINIFVNDKLIKEKILNWPVSSKDIVNWQDDDGSITRKDLTSINTRLLLNRTNPRGATPKEVNSREGVALRFWQSVQQIPFLGSRGAKIQSVAAQPVVLKALAKLTYDLAFGRGRNPLDLDTLLSGIPSVDFSHGNPMWRYYLMTDQERIENGLQDLKRFLPNDSHQGESFNRDIGGFDPKAQLMRFGAKHNDIYPIIGDMVRWKLGLPSRRKITLENLDLVGEANASLHDSVEN